jgi:hypothetical protein
MKQNINEIEEELKKLSEKGSSLKKIDDISSILEKLDPHLICSLQS